MISNKRFNSKTVSVRIKKHVYFDEVTEVSFNFYIKRKMVGWLDVVNNYGKKFETHSGIDAPELKGLGLGLFMYSTAADWCTKNGLYLYSSCAPSREAKRLWNSRTLRKKYIVKPIRFNRWKIAPFYITANGTKRIRPKKNIILPQVIKTVTVNHRNGAW